MGPLERLLLAGALAGCQFRPGVALDEPMGDAASGDAVDPLIDGAVPCVPWSFQPAELNPCLLPPPLVLPAMTPGTYVLDSETGVLTGAGIGNLALPYLQVNGVGVVSLSGVTIPPDVIVRGVGSLPLVIASSDSITIASGGRIDVSSAIGLMPGAGANAPGCGGGIGTGNAAGDGGGGGGGYAAAGGLGGIGGNGNGGGGTAGGIRAQPAIVRGGCPGGDAGTSGAGTRGLRGNSGGAIALVARVSIMIDGIVHAGGSGGTGGATNQNGGGGGGSGGMIKLDSMTLTIGATSVLAANGGQGGGGCNNNTAGNGASGGPNASEPAIGNSEAGGGDGGGGGFVSRPTGNSAGMANDGGGGGGGGVGWIVHRGAATFSVNSTQSPTATPF